MAKRTGEETGQAGESKAKAEEKAANVKWVGLKDGNPYKVQAVEGQKESDVPVDNFVAEGVKITRPFSEPVASFSAGGKRYDLPAADEQKKGFYFQNVKLLINSVPGYKKIV
jgi:hypothetical protein